MPMGDPTKAPLSMHTHLRTVGQGCSRNRPHSLPDSLDLSPQLHGNPWSPCRPGWEDGEAAGQPLPLSRLLMQLTMRHLLAAVLCFSMNVIKNFALCLTKTRFLVSRL